VKKGSSGSGSKHEAERSLAQIERPETGGVRLINGHVECETCLWGIQVPLKKLEYREKVQYF